MKITEYIKKNTVILDGGMGTMLQQRGLGSGDRSDTWNITHPDIVEDIHRQYLEAGANIICTNTFGANILHYSPDDLEKVVFAAVKNARAAVDNSSLKNKRWIALDIGPTGRMLKPLGDLDFEDAVEIFAKTVRLGVKAGVDLIFIETMSDSYEAKAALLAAKESSDLPVFVSCAFGEDGKLMTGASALAMVAMLEGMGADAIGVNCSFGPDLLIPTVREYLKYASVPIIFKPNAGMPTVENKETVYSLTPEDFARSISPLVAEGVRAVGGCCGTTPEYIRHLADLVKDITPKPLTKKENTLISSYTHAVELGGHPVLIGERINPTGKPRFREALKTGDVDYILREGIAEEEAGAEVLDVNVGIPGINEGDMLCSVISSLQAVCDLPLQIDSSDPAAMERAMRIYNGKAMVNSVNGKADSMAAVFPLVKKYGGVVVALTLDENGIPETAAGRVKIAKKILAEAKKYKVDKKNIIFDPLAMTVSTNKNAAKETLDAIRMITDQMGCHTILGVSNVSFGLPNRDRVNAAFFTMAVANGLTAAIANPHSEEMKRAYAGSIALCGCSDSLEKYISLSTETAVEKEGDIFDLKGAIIKGMKDRAAALTREKLSEEEPLEIIDRYIIPALNEVGDGFEKKRIYLPGLLMSAEAAGSAFDVIKAASHTVKKMGKRILLATVKGDIHDIGKNILKLILENYGYEVIDLGKDVSPEKIVEAASRGTVDVIGLSALMTTTIPAMEQTVKLIKDRIPNCRVMVGGAVLTEEYAIEIGADFYGKDAMSAVKYIGSL